MADNRTILVVDDEPATLEGYRAFLTPPETAKPARRSSRRAASESDDEGTQDREEYRLLAASSGEEAIALVEKELSEGRQVAAGFFDVKLGSGIDGLQTIQRIRGLDPAIHCVVVTAYHDRTVQEINRLFGDEFKDHWDYLNKPFTEGEIIQKARQMVAAWNRRRQIEEMHAQLVRSERLAAVGQVARGIGHEFGNILLRIMGKTDLALMEKDVEKIHSHLQVVMTASERAGVIVKNLQSFSRTQPQYGIGPLHKPLEEAATLIQHELVKASLRFEKEFADCPPVRMDIGALAQVFLNLIINAVHATAPGGVIRLRVAAENSPSGKPGVAARVGDTGTGIPAEVLPRIFEYAFSTKGERGSGLGLAISRELVEAHGGEISVATTVGQGTEFRVWLPLAPAQQQEISS